MDPPNVFEQHPIGGGTRAFDARAPGIVAADGQTQRLAHHSDRPEVAILIDEPELHREAAPKMSAAFFRISRSIRSRSFSRRKGAFSAARSDGDGTGTCVIGRRAGPVAWPPSRITHRLSTVSLSPNSVATLPIGKPLLITRSTASRLKTSGNTRRVVLMRHLPPGSKAWHRCPPNRGKITARTRRFSFGATDLSAPGAVAGKWTWSSPVSTISDGWSHREADRVPFPNSLGP